jgi:hypothetical protein
MFNAKINKKGACPITILENRNWEWMDEQCSKGLKHPIFLIMSLINIETHKIPIT